MVANAPENLGSSEDVFITLNPLTLVTACDVLPGSDGLLRLTSLETIIPDIQLPQAFYFDCVLDAEKLREGLRRILVKYPQVAGRLVGVGEDCYLVIDRNNAGVSFQTGTSTLRLHDLAPPLTPGGISTPHLATAQLLPPALPMIRAQYIATAAPLAYFILVELADATSVLSVTFPHFLVDEPAMIMFIRDWGAMVRGDIVVSQVAGTAAEAVEGNVVPFEGNVLTEDQGIVFASPEKLAAFYAAIEKFVILERAYVSKTFHIPGEALERLTGKIRERDPRVSQNDALSAFLWK
ncbi:hypothetical protein HK104_004487, partial [Borealophlyctis nickersoniae]